MFGDELGGSNTITLQFLRVLEKWFSAAKWQVIFQRLLTRNIFQKLVEKIVLEDFKYSLLTFNILFNLINGKEENTEVFSLSSQIHITNYPSEELAKQSKQTICIIKAIRSLTEMPVKKHCVRCGEHGCNLQWDKLSCNSVTQSQQDTLSVVLLNSLLVPTSPGFPTHQENKTPLKPLQYIIRRLQESQKFI